MERTIEYDIEGEDRLPVELLEQIKNYLRQQVIPSFRAGTVETLVFYSSRHELRAPVSVREKEMDGGNDLLVEVYSSKGIEEPPSGIYRSEDEYIAKHRQPTWTETVEAIRLQTERTRAYLTIEEVHKYFPPFQHIFESGEHSCTFTQVKLL